MNKRDPYVVRTRRTTGPRPDEASGGDGDYMAFGTDPAKGVDVRIQTERGAISLKVWRNEFGDEQVVLRAFEHTDFGGRKVGTKGILWQGTVDGQWHGQTSMFGEEPA